MENTPITSPESVTATEKKETKSKKKKAENLGAFIVEPKSQKPDKSSEKSEKPAKKSENAEAAEPLESESEAPLEHLGEAEKQFVERELVQAEAAEAEPDVAAIERFRELIATEGQDSDAAFETTIAELHALPDAAVEHDSVTDPERVEMAVEHMEEADEPQEFGDHEIHINEAPVAAPEDPNIPTPPVIGGAIGHGQQPPRRPIRNTEPQTPETRYVPYRDGTDLLVGGVIGYLIGRRRGRIKTEKRLIPVQKKLQKEVAAVRSELSFKEDAIRKLAAKKVAPPPRPRQHIERPRVPDHSEQFAAPKLNRVEQASPLAAAAVERPRAELRASAPETASLHANREASEQIGHMVITAEAVSRQSQKEAMKKPQNIEKQPPAKPTAEKNIATLNRAELLAVSEKIIVDGTSLRHIYETKLVGEKGLRRLVQEHLKSGDIKKALRREIVEREIDFERDPYLRDRGQDGSGPVGGGKQAALHELLKNVAVPGQVDEEEVAFLKARSAFEAKVREDEKKRRKVMDVGLITTIFVLIICILALVMAHT